MPIPDEDEIERLSELAWVALYERVDHRHWGDLKETVEVIVRTILSVEANR